MKKFLYIIAVALVAVVPSFAQCGRGGSYHGGARHSGSGFRTGLGVGIGLMVLNGALVSSACNSSYSYSDVRIQSGGSYFRYSSGPVMCAPPVYATPVYVSRGPQVVYQWVSIPVTHPPEYATRWDASGHIYYEVVKEAWTEWKPVYQQVWVP